jgi:hypothetical protein
MPQATGPEIRAKAKGRSLDQNPATIEKEEGRLTIVEAAMPIPRCGF